MPDDRLRALLKERAQAVSDEAFENGGHVSEEHVADLERLGRLVKVYELAQEPPRRKRWPMAAALGATLLIASLLLFARVPRTDVELELAVSEVGFTLPAQQVLADVMDLSAIGVTGLEHLQLPPQGGLANRFSEVVAGVEHSIRVSSVSDASRVGTVNLDALMLPAGTRVRLRHLETPRTYHLLLEGKGPDLRVSVHGPTQIGIPGAPAEDVDFAVPHSILLQPSDVVEMNLTLPEASSTGFTPLLQLEDLSLFRIDEYTGAEGTVVRRVSAIQSGTIYFESLDGQARRLRPGQALHFDLVQGEIRTLQLDEDHITLHVRGRVRGMSTGAEENLRSLMPTYLDWLQARHGITLLWGTALYLFGLIAGVLRWWGMRV